jgi:hypothetical protein
MITQIARMITHLPAGRQGFLPGSDRPPIGATKSLSVSPQRALTIFQGSHNFLLTHRLSLNIKGWEVFPLLNRRECNV